jgi:hypothetical protein
LFPTTIHWISKHAKPIGSAFHPRGKLRAGFMQKTNFRGQFTNAADACALAQSIVDTVREPVVVLDKGLRVIAASRSFYSASR